LPPAYILFLAGVFVSAAANLFTSIVTSRFEYAVTVFISLSASFWMLASIFAFYLGSRIEDLRVIVDRAADPDVEQEDIDTALDAHLRSRKGWLIVLWLLTIVLVAGALWTGVVAHMQLPLDEKPSADVSTVSTIAKPATVSPSPRP
jgi:anaerobic C4-dicarboxylate transporter